jgi:hypothetical protein
VENLTIQQIKDFVIVAVAVLAFIVLMGNVIKTIKDWRKPGMSEQEWRRDVDDKLGNDNKRIKSLEDGNRVICKALMALLSHEINGNSNDKLQKALSDLNNYLIEK